VLRWLLCYATAVAASFIELSLPALPAHYQVFAPRLASEEKSALEKLGLAKHE